MAIGVQCITAPGQSIILVGNTASLGEWNVEQGVEATWTEGHIWRAEIEVVAGGYQEGGGAGVGGARGLSSAGAQSWVQHV